MSDLPPPPPPEDLPPRPPPAFTNEPPPGYVSYGQHAGPQATLAGFWIRFGALLLDALIVGIPTSIVAGIIGADGASGNLLNIVVGLVYYSALEGGPTGQTLGKKICGLQVVDANTGQPGIGVGRGVGRYFARWLSGIPLGLGYFWMLWDPKKQCWHDKLVNDLVVKL